MESNDQDPTTEQAGTPAGTPSPEPPADPPAGGGSTPTGGAADGPRRLYRSRDQRLLGGVCGGLAEYFGIDPAIVRIIAVALVFAGGAGFLAYGAAWLLVPQEGDETPGRSGLTGRAATIAGVVLLVLAIGTILPFSQFPFDGWAFGGPLLSLVCVGLVGLGVWWLASGENPPAPGTHDILRRAGLGLALLAVCGLLAIGGAWATAAGGGAVVAVAIIVAGVWLVAGAFLGGARWLILPALALALPAGVVSAANVNIDGGVGDRRYHPVAFTELQPSYRLGIGHLVVDLRDANLPPGDQPLRVDVGVGAVTIAVPKDVCVTSAAHIGAGEVAVFDRTSGGLDVGWRDDRRALPGTTRLIVDGDIGVGVLQVTHEDPDRVSPGERFDPRRESPDTACIGGTRG
jgi:phage shock protein PspC (stress-responsive transcriptional regulator)